MSQRRTTPNILPEGEGIDPDHLSLEGEITNSIAARMRRWVPCVLGTIPMFLVGTIYGWASNSLVPLTTGSDDVPLTLTRDEYAWSVSVTVLGSIFGALLAAHLADRIGRKYCLLTCCIMFTLGWYHMYTATTVSMIYFARAILGIGVGISRTINPMFVSEVTDIKYRGSLAVLIAANVYSGSLLAYTLGESLAYTSHIIALAVISSISILPLICLRETPYFLVAKGQKPQACKSIAFYKGIKDPDKVKVELRALRAEARYGLHQQYRIDLPPPYSINLPLPSSSDLPPPYFSNLPSPSSSDLPPPYSSNLPSPSRNDLLPPYGSNLPSQSIRETHSEVLSQVHQQPTGELRLQSTRDSFELHLLPSCELQSQFTRQIHQTSTSQIHQTSAGEVHRPSASEKHSQSTSELHQTSAGEVHRPSTSEKQSQSTSELHRPSTSEVHRPSISEKHSQSTSELHRPSTSEKHSQSTSELHQTSAGEVHRPSTSEKQSQCTSELHRPSTSEVHRPSTSEKHSQSTSELHRPSTSEVHQPSTSEKHSQSTSEVHRPSKSEVHRPSTSEKHSQSTSELHRPSTSEVHQPSGSEVHRSSTSEVHRPSASEVHRSSISEVHQPPTSEVHRPSTSEKHSQSTSELHQTSAGEVHRPSTSEVHRSSTSEVHRPSTSEVHRSSTSEVHGPPTCEIQEPPTSQVLPQTRSELHRQSGVDSRASTDIPETHNNVTKYTCLDKLLAILQRSNSKALIIMLSLIMAQQLSGNFTATQYLQELLNREIIFIDVYNAIILVELLRIFSVYLTALIVVWCGRRKLLILSTLGSCSTLLILATASLIDRDKNKVPIVSAFLVIVLIIYQVMFHIGLGTLPNILLCDLFPTKLKGFVCAIVVIFDSIIGFIASRLYQEITAKLERNTIFMICTSTCCLAYLVVFTWVPETKGKTYDEIEELLAGENLNSSNEEVSSDEMDIHRI